MVDYCKKSLKEVIIDELTSPFTYAGMVVTIFYYLPYMRTEIRYEAFTMFLTFVGLYITFMYIYPKLVEEEQKRKELLGVPRG